MRPGRVLAACCALALTATACSSGSADETGATSTTTSTTTSSEPATTAAETETTAPATSAADSTQADTTEVATTLAATTEVATTDAAAAETTAPSHDGPLTIEELLHLGRPVVLAHGGGEDQFPHSTPYAFGESVQAGVDMLDFDVQLTADGVLVVQHDDHTGRTADHDLVIADSTYDELSTLDNAYWFTDACTCTGQPDAAYTLRGIRTGAKPAPPGFTPDDFTIPRFEDLVERFPDMPVNVEIKGSGAPAIAAASELARILTDHDLLDNAVVASFDDTVVQAFHELAPTVEMTPGLGAASAFILGGTPLPDGMRILQLPVSFNGLDVLSPEHIAASKAAGYIIWVWPDDHAYENAGGYAQLLADGLDGLNINYPATGVQAVADFLAED